MLPHLKCKEGDIVFVRATVVSACSDAFQVRVEDHPKFVSTHWVPAREVAKEEDVRELPAIRRVDLKFLDPDHYGKSGERLYGSNGQKLPK